MPAILRSPPAVPLLILTIPVVGIAIQANVGGGEPPSMRSWYGLLVAACLLAALMLFALARSRAPKRGQPLDESANERGMATIPLAFAMTVDALALLFAQSSIALASLLVAVAAAWILLWSSRAVRTIGIRTSLVIERDPSVVFAFISDAQNAPKYIPELESVEKITDGPIGSGTQFRSRMRLPNGVFEGVSEVVEYEPPSRVTSRLASGLRPNLETLTFEPVDQGTLLKHRFESELSYNSALMGMGLLQWSMTNQMVTRRRQIWARAKQILEGPPTP